MKPRAIPGKRRQLLGWPLAAVGFHLALVVTIWIVNDWSLRPVLDAHDGQFYVAHLRDPLLMGSLEAWEGANIPYRVVRIGYVFAALPLRWLGAVPALVIVNLVAVGAGAYAVREIARRHRADERLASVVWILNPGALVATALVLPDVLAWCLVLFGLLAMDERRWIPATLLGVLAVMTKMASLAALGMASLMKLRRGRKAAVMPVVIPALVHGAALGIATWRFGPSVHERFITWPFDGWIAVIGRWAGVPLINPLMGALLFSGGILVVVAWLRRRSFFLSAAAGQALMAAFLSSSVLLPMANTARIAGLFWPLLFATSRDRKRRPSKLRLGTLNAQTSGPRGRG